jgi:glyceraldehyde 3-phosphate dehydrogenase
MITKGSLVLAMAGTASAFSLGSSFVPKMGGVETAVRASTSSGPTMAAVPCGINGFGRIGRLVARIMIKDPETNLVHVNAGSATTDYMAYQFKYDSIHGRFDGTTVVDGDDLVIDGNRIICTRERDPKNIGWGKTGAEYLCESTGVFLTADTAKAHIDGGAKKVIFSAPAKDDSLTVVMGVNQEDYKGQTDYVSCASCTTNGLAPMVKAINDAYEIEEGLMTTIHAMTATQAVVDSSSRKDWRGGRAASGNIIPSSTGAAKAVAKVIPAVKGKLTGMAFRVPTIDVSVVDLTCRIKKATTYEEICTEIQRRANGDMKGFLGYTDEPLVSTDFETEATSSTFDAGAGIMLNPNFVKVVAWYDNEWGYSTRVKDLMVHMAKVDAAAKK